MAQKWEYRSEIVNGYGNYRNWEDGKIIWLPFNDLGKEGWELAHIGFEYDGEAQAIFKRPLIEETQTNAETPTDHV